MATVNTMVSTREKMGEGAMDRMMTPAMKKKKRKMMLAKKVMK